MDNVSLRTLIPKEKMHVVAVIVFLFGGLGFTPAEPAGHNTPCGPDIPAMACIPAGEFIRGSTSGPADERPAEKIYLKAFYMDIYEVTFSEYQACVTAKKCQRARPNYEGFSEAKQPMTGVSWFGADEFCRAHGKRLPTEAEWEKAARTEDGRVFPWGNEPATCERAIIKDADSHRLRHRQSLAGRFAAAEPVRTATIWPATLWNGWRIGIVPKLPGLRKRLPRQKSRPVRAAVHFPVPAAT